MSDQKEPEVPDYRSKQVDPAVWDKSYKDRDAAQRDFQSRPSVERQNVPRDPKKNTYSSGATRNKDADSYRFDLIPAVSLRRIAKIFAEGGRVHGDRNWENGQPIAVVLNHAENHLNAWKSGCRKEDHLAKVAWAMMALMYYEHQGIDIDGTAKYFEGLMRKPNSHAKIQT